MSKPVEEKKTLGSPTTAEMTGDSGYRKLKVLLLGPPEFQLEDGTPISIKRRVPRSLLVYLAFHKDMIGRAELILLLWPETSKDVGRRRLREILAKLRAEMPDSSMLLTRQDQVGLDHDNIYVDALEFENLLEQVQLAIGRLSLDQPLPESVYQKVRSAVDLWRTPKFLAGVNLPDTEGFSQWFMETSRTLERSHQVLVERLADHHAASGDLAEAIRWVRAALGADVQNPELHYRLLKWFNALGLRSEALKQCRDLRKLYNREGVELPDSVKELCQQVSEHAPPSRTVDHPAWASPTFLQTVFVGRKVELNALNRAFQRGGVMYLSGESGSGKTRLIYEFYRQLPPSTRVLVASADPSENDLPYQPLIETLRRSISDEEWRELAPVWGASLVNLLPELTLLLSEGPSYHNIVSVDAASQIFNALHQLFLLLAQKGRVFLFFDDAHWSDATTLNALSYMQKRGFFGEYGLLVMAVRPGEHNPDIGDFLGKFQNPPGNLLEHSLGELSQDEVGELITSILGRRYSERVVKQLIDQVSGNPLLLIETLRMFLDQSPGVSFEEAVTQLPLSDSVHTLLYGRVKHLSSPSQQVLTNAAVIGSEFSLELLEAVVDMDVEKVVEAVEELEKNHLIYPMPQKDSRFVFAFTHEKIREVILRELPLVRGRMLNLRIAQAMESLGVQDGPYASVVARHYEAAGELHEAFHYWVKAGEHARRLFSKTQTYQAYRKAEGLSQLLNDSLSDVDIYRLYFNWADFSDDIADYDMLSRVASSFFRIGRERQSSLLIGSSLSNCSRTYRRQNEYTESLQAIEEALPHLERCGNTLERIKGYNRYAIVLAYLSRFEDSDNALERAFELAVDPDDLLLQSALANTLLQIAMLYNFKALPLKAAELAERTMHRYKGLFDTIYTTVNQATLANSYYLMGRYAEAYELCQAAFQSVASMQNWRINVVISVVAARVELCLGYLDDSWGHVNEAMQLVEEYGLQKSFFGQLFTVKGDILWMIRDLSSATESFRIGLENSRLRHNEINNRFRMGVALMWDRQNERGLELVEQAGVEADDDGFSYIFLSSQVVKAWDHVRNDEQEKALDILQEVIAEAESRELIDIMVNAKLYYGTNAFQSGDFTTARHYAQWVIETAQTMKYVWLEIRGHQLLHAIELKEGSHSSQSEQRVRGLMGFIRQHTHTVELRSAIDDYFEIILEEFS
jgi:DNA-binding SARP family transcriptional activator